MKRRMFLHSAPVVGAGLLLAVCGASPAEARCVTNGTTTTCDTAPPNPETVPVENTTVILLPNAAVSPNNAPFPPPPFALGSVVIDQNGSLTAGAGSLITDQGPRGGDALALLAGATASISGTVTSTNTGSRAVVLFGEGSSLTLNQGGLIEVSGAVTAGFRPSKAAISTGQGNPATIVINGTVRSLTNDAPAVAGFNTGAPAGATRFGPVTLTVGATGLIETTGDRAPAIHLGGTSSATIAGTVRSSGVDSPAILSLGTTISILQGGLVTSSVAPAISGSSPNLTIAGTVTGPGANAVAIDLGASDDVVTLTSTGKVNGILSGGAGTDRLSLSAANGASGTYDFQAQPVTGFEQLTKEGAGTFMLSGDARSTGIGTVAVNGGTLVQNANFSGTAFTVASGARLTGTGPVGNLSVSGTIAPGSGIGTINVGSATFNAGSVYEVQANSAGAADRINVAGSAVVNGGTVQVLAESGTYAPSTQYTIVSAAAGVSGAFGDVTSNLAFLTPSLSYSANEVRLVLTRNDIHFSDAASNPNQRATALALEGLGAANPIYIFLVSQSAAGARAAFDAASGEIYPSISGFLTLNSRLPRRGLVNAAADAPEGLAVWGDAGETWGRNGADAAVGTARGRSDTTGVQGGFTWRRNGFVAALGAGGYDQDYRVADRASRASIRTTFFGGTLGYAAGPVSLLGGYGYGSHDLTVLRTIGFADLGQTGAKTKGHTSQFFADAAYGLTAGPVRAALFANYAHVSTHIDAATEVVSPARLGVDAENMDSGFLSAGVRVRGTAPSTGRLAVVPNVSVAYVRTTGDRRGLSAMHFQGQATPFVIGGAPLPRSAAEIRGGLDLVARKVRIGLSYDGLIGSRWNEHGARLTGSFSF